MQSKRYNRARLCFGGDVRIACYVKTSKLDQKTLAKQMNEMKECAKKNNWTVVLECREVGKEAKYLKKREELIQTAVRGDIDLIMVCSLDRWGQSIIDLITSINRLKESDVGFVSIKESINLTSKSDTSIVHIFKALAHFEHELSSAKIKAGIAQARKKGILHGRPITVGQKKNQIVRLFKQGLNKSEIAQKLKIGRTSVRRLLNS